MPANHEADASAQRLDAAVTGQPEASVNPPSVMPTTSQVVAAKTPATATDEGSSDRTTDVPSARPTSVPGYFAKAVARGALTWEPPRNVPLAIPHRVGGTDASMLPHAAAFVLMHVDGVSTVTAIAKLADLPLDDVITYFLELAALGLVTIGEKPMMMTVPPESNVQRKKSGG